MSGFTCGIVGLPNVGKSTLFSALSGVAVAAENYPFCTIDPNIAIVEVPDERLKVLSELVTTQKLVPAVVEFVDIAGLVRGASKGEGLGNQFLSHIRSVDAIVHVLRCFESGDIIHVEGRVDPIADLETIEVELALSDLEVAGKRMQGLDRKVKSGDKEAAEVAEVLKKVLGPLEQGKSIKALRLAQKEKDLLKDLNLLGLKQELYVANLGEEDLTKGNAHLTRVIERGKAMGIDVVPVCGKVEAEIASLPIDERAAFLEEMKITESGLSRIIRAGYHMLGLRTFFTVGPKEIHAWTFQEGSMAPQAAGRIHTDFEKGFIRAETYHYEDLVKHRTEKAIRDAGRMRMEGKDYVVQDGDIMVFHFSN